jgi:hypothetical protein
MIQLLVIVLRIFTFIELHYNKVIFVIKTYIPYSNNEYNELEFIKNMNNTKSFYLFNDYLKSGKKNTVIIHNYIEPEINNIYYTESNVKFISCYLSLNNKDYIIDLKNPFNLYILDNVLNYVFISYYLTTTYPQLKTVDLSLGKISIIDQNANIFIEPFTEKFQIAFTENNYKLNSI